MSFLNLENKRYLVMGVCLRRALDMNSDGLLRGHDAEAHLLALDRERSRCQENL